MMPDLRRLILLSVLCVLASLAVTASASAATLFTNPTPITIDVPEGHTSPYPRATFSEVMRGSSINTNTFKLFKAGTTSAIGATVSYDAATKKATLNPNNNLRPGTKYKAVVTTGARDLAGNRLDQKPGVSGNQSKVWFFTTKRR